MKALLLIAVAIAALVYLSCGTDMSKYVSADGITIPENSPGVPKGLAYIESRPGSDVEIALTGKGTPQYVALTFSGTFSTTGDGRPASGTEKFRPIKMKTFKGVDQWISVSSFSIGKDGFLVVTDGSGASYRIEISLNMYGTIEKLGWW